MNNVFQHNGNPTANLFGCSTAFVPGTLEVSHWRRWDLSRSVLDGPFCRLHTLSMKVQRCESNHNDILMLFIVRHQMTLYPAAIKTGYTCTFTIVDLTAVSSGTPSPTGVTYLVRIKDSSVVPNTLEVKSATAQCARWHPFYSNCRFRWLFGRRNYPLTRLSVAPSPSQPRPQ
jgi:hypothetical protein